MNQAQAALIYEPIREDLTTIETRLRRLDHIPFPFLADLLKHVLDAGGKRIRPAITLLASKFHDHDPRVTHAMAIAVELLHIATLIHDDTVDNSDIRRGKATVSNLWGRNVAVLMGDYLFATSATYVCDTGNIRVIRRFSETIMELSSGELFEIADAFNWRQARKQYLDRIHKKTASLFTTAGESGAILSGAPETTVLALKEYSYNLGMAFQIVDDILDLDGTSEETGKPVGHDLAQGVMTLPAIIAIEQQPDDNPIAELFRQPADGATLERAVRLIQEPSVIRAAQDVARDYCQRALDSLDALPGNRFRDSLEGLAQYVLSRRS